MPFNPTFTITPKINNVLVEIESVSAARKLNALTTSEHETLLTVVIDKTFRGEL